MEIVWAEVLETELNSKTFVKQRRHPDQTLSNVFFDLGVPSPLISLRTSSGLRTDREVAAAL